LFSQFITILDDYSEHLESRNFIFVLGVTTDLEMIDKKVMTVNRLEKSIELKIPNFDSRLEIIESLLNEQSVDENTIKVIVENTNGYVLADLNKLMYKLLEIEENKFVIPSNNLLLKIKNNKPFVISKTSNNDDIIVNGGLSLDDFYGIDDIKKKIKVSILDPLNNFERYLKIGISPPKGILFFY
jgi:transitional endoplasmic reticulum ATPase